jgi:hypothetical protein
MLASILPGTASPAGDGQAELGYQPVREPGRTQPVQPRQQHWQRAPADLHPGSGRQIDFTPAIAPQHGT